MQNGNLGLMSTRPTPAPAPSTPAAAVAVPPSSTAPSEAPTILGRDDDEAAGPLSLQRRAPPVKKVIEAVMDCDALDGRYDKIPVISWHGLRRRIGWGPGFV